MAVVAKYKIDFCEKKILPAEICFVIFIIIIYVSYFYLFGFYFAVMMRILGDPDLDPDSGCHN